MENSSIIKQAKSDIFKELHPIIDFYIKKGATPTALKKYYKNSKRLNDLKEDIKNKGINLIKDEEEYKKLLKEILNDLLDDFIAKQKDEEYRNKMKKDMKHIKEFNSFEEVNEFFITTTMTVIAGIALGNILTLISRHIEDNYVLNKIRKRLESDDIFEVEKKDDTLEVNIDDEYLLKFTHDLLTIKKLPIKKYYLGHRIFTLPIDNEEHYQKLISLIKKTNIK